MTAATLTGYGMKPVATFHIDVDRFVMTVTDPDGAAISCGIYAFLIGNQIVRFGSSKAALSSRLRSWERDVSISLRGGKSSTPHDEARGWRELLPPNAVGTVFARVGTTITTPVGTFNAYMAEESYLIGHHLPVMNRSKHR